MGLMFKKGTCISKYMLDFSSGQAWYQAWYLDIKKKKKLLGIITIILVPSTQEINEWNLPCMFSKPNYKVEV